MTKVCSLAGAHLPQLGRRRDELLECACRICSVHAGDQGSCEGIGGNPKVLERRQIAPIGGQRACTSNMKVWGFRESIRPPAACLLDLVGSS